MIGIGHTLGGKFRLVRLLGDGGMGAVYEAVHERLGTHVAIKVVHPDIARRPGIVDRFLQEAKVAAQIKSPHVVQVADVDQTPEGLPYMVMELLEGEPLASLLERERKLPIATACAYAVQVLEGLEAAHAIGVVHRDLKPDNVFVTFVAQKPVLKLIDFGIAKVRREDQRNLTVAGITMGTAEYMPPEQAFSADKADARSDLYSVGVLLYEMLSGQRPVTGEDARAVAVKVERGEVKPLVHAAPEVPQRLAGLCHRAMAPRQEMRFASATEMRIALEEIAAGRVPSAPDGQVDPRLQNVPATTTTVRAAPLPDAPPAAQTPVGAPQQPFESTQRTPPMGGNAPAPAPFVSGAGAVPAAPPAPQRSPSVRPRRRKGGTTWLLVALPILLGAAVVAALIWSHQDGGGDNPQPTITPTTTAAPDAAGAPTATSTSDPLPTLKPTTYVPPPATAPTHAAGDAAPPSPAGDGAAPPATTTSPFPPLPSNLPPFPFPIPSGSVFQIPSNLPPLFPPPPPAPTN